MPNYCDGTITLYASDERIKEVFAAIHGKDDNPFDFNKIIPMPEALNVTQDFHEDLAYTAFICDGERLTKEEFLERLESSEENKMLCEEMTRYLFNESKDERISGIFDRYLQEWESGNANKMLDEGTLLVSNIRNYGAPTWYEWCCKNWGTKWNSCDAEIRDHSICFYTAWSPCSEIIRALAVMFPDITFEYYYDEAGIGFCGREVYSNGSVLYYMEGNYSEYWLEAEDDEDQSIDYTEGYYDEKVEILEETTEYKIGTIAIREDRDGCIYTKNGTFTDWGLDKDNRFFNAA